MYMTSTTTTSTTERYVPAVASASLVADAPGYGRRGASGGHGDDDDVDGDGPACWKCRGSGGGMARNLRPRRRRRSNNSDHSNEPQLDAAPAAAATAGGDRCPVCRGKGRLAARRTAASPGKITRGRRRPGGGSVVMAATAALGPDPAGYAVPLYGDLVRAATANGVDVVILPPTAEPPDGPPATTMKHEDSTTISTVTVAAAVAVAAVAAPAWLPRATEELCNLTGSWRILQRVRSHRWTTDDLVTAAVAGQALLDIVDDRTAAGGAGGAGIAGLSYCDLGTGNASVLLMVLWKAAAAKIRIERAVGVEARSEAVGLARRSVAFNLGETAGSVAIVHADFRSYCLEPPRLDHSRRQQPQYDLITGTPPYFRVDFRIAAETGAVESATIRQGGMPTAVQSAPARCEFRGGFEAYCEVAALLLHPARGRFCVCVNYKNHARALAAFATYQLVLLTVYKVEGKVGRGPLFCVYVVRLQQAAADDDAHRARHTVVELAVRDANGDWTDDYCAQVLQFMAIPTLRAEPATATT